MKLLTMYSVLGIGAIAAAAACSSSSGGNSTGDGGGSSSSGSSSGSSSSGSSSGSSSSGGSSGSSSGSSGGLPTITITSPTAGGTVALTKQTGSGEVDAPISFTTTGFMLMPAGACGTVTSGCGHVHLYVDPNPDGGASPCTPAGAPYNNAIPLAAGQGSPINAIISSCAASDPADGTHTVLLELHSDQHAPIDDANGKTISATVSFTATGP